MLSRRHLLDRSNRCWPPALPSPAPGRKPQRGRSSSIPCPMRRPRTSRISMRRPWRSTMASITRPMSTISTRRSPRTPRRPRCRSRRCWRTSSKLPESIRTAVRNNGGGHANHTMFWQIMGGSGGEPSGELKAAIDRDLGGFEKFQDRFQHRRREAVRLRLGLRHGRPRRQARPRRASPTRTRR